jgi:3-phosphoshikimate 1-carboxyvinyltransferase
MHADTDGLSVRFGGALHGGSIDAERWPDGSLAVMAAAATSIEPIEIRGLATLAQKESDRIETMRAWLVDLGVRVERGEDWVRMQGPPRTGATAMVATQRDHRIAMSAAVLGALHGGVQVDDPGCVAKSWPDFWSSWAKLLGP